ncbi:MAG: ATP-binding protein [Treponema sp.]|nr:ATP-binding protein [Treponema sp.]
MDIERTIGPVIKRVSKGFPIILLAGMRQIGKTYLLEKIKESERQYVSLDFPDQRELAKNHPDLFLQRYKPPLLIDEVQYAPELLTYIKIYVDTHKQNGLFWLTGSQKFSLMKGIQESLAGRVAILDMLGFSYREAAGQAKSVPFLPSKNIKHVSPNGINMNILDFYKIIWTGSFPRLVVQNGKNWEFFYRSYLRTYIERDIKDYQGIDDSIKFYKFIRAAAVRTGSLLNYADLARDTDIDVRTAKTWLSALERSGLVKLLYPYFNNITKRLIKTPKLYFMDTGLCAFLAGMDTPKALEASYLSGAILETWAFIEILKSYWHNGEDPAIYYYRDADQREIDFIIEKNMTLYPIEVKKTSAPVEENARQFIHLEKLKKPIGMGAVLCLRSSPLPLNRHTVAWPVWEV